ncbi:hypothetical protein BK654_13510 [Pseudomonas brassicacearum]|nr:hypothetical protein BK654_13510 [Pseudomonas brassicacearum]
MVAGSSESGFRLASSVMPCLLIQGRPLDRARDGVYSGYRAQIQCQVESPVGASLLAIAVDQSTSMWM